MGTRYVWRCLVLLFLFPSLGCADKTPTELTKERCEQQGGQWGHFGLLPKEQCNLPAHDAGKVCHDKSDCQGACIARVTPQEKAELAQGKILTTSGYCSEKKLNFGCLPFVEKGKVHGILCAD